MDTNAKNTKEPIWTVLGYKCEEDFFKDMEPFAHILSEDDLNMLINDLETELKNRKDKKDKKEEKDTKNKKIIRTCCHPFDDNMFLLEMIIALHLFDGGNYRLD